MYQTLVWPLVTYVCETWVLKENTKTKLRVFERKALRRIYGPTKESDGTWRIKSNEELNRLIGNKNIINYIKAHRLAWFGHVHRMPDNSMVKKCIWVVTRTNKITRKTQGRIKLFGAPRQWEHFRPLFQAVFLSGGGGYYPPRLSQTPRPPVPRQK